MKKAVAISMILVLVFLSVPQGINRTSAASLFSDAPQSSWYYKDLEYITKDSRKIIEGYKGKFYPSGNLTVEQFLKCVTVASGFVAKPVSAGMSWSFPYIEKAVSMKLVEGGEFNKYDRGITRAEMSRIIVRVLPSITGETKTSYDLANMKALMSDYASIPESMKDYVCQAYQLGILQGSKGKFNPGSTLTRAEAVAVIHRVLDKNARIKVPEPEVSEIWSDAEFEAFMRSGDVKNYMNTYKVAKIENRKIYWKSNQNPGQQVLVPEDKNPGVNEMIYNIVKIMAYHTKKTDGYMVINYLDDTTEHEFSTKFYVGKEDHSHLRYGAIELYIHSNPLKSKVADKYFPGKQKGDTHYKWYFGAIYDNEKVRDFKPGMDRTKFEWTAPKYESIIRDVSEEVYGSQQGKYFFDFALKEIDQDFLTGGNHKASYIGFNNDIGCEVVYYYPEKDFPIIRISTDKPEVEE